MRSRVGVEGDLRVEIGRIFSFLYFHFFPRFNFIFWLIWLISEGRINPSFYKSDYFTDGAIEPWEAQLGLFPGVLMSYPQHLD